LAIVDEDIAKTLGELERKLRELEHVLSNIGGTDAHAGDSGAPRPAYSPPTQQAPQAARHMAGEGRLIDEALERPEPVPRSFEPHTARDAPAAPRPNAPAPTPTPPIEALGQATPTTGLGEDTRTTQQVRSVRRLPRSCFASAIGSSARRRS